MKRAAGSGPPPIRIERVPAILEITALSKRFGALTVADAIELALDQGEALGIIGPNGAGKSTLFNLIAGIVKPDTGRISFGGRDITGTSPMQRCIGGIGRTFQIPQPFEKLTVFENVLVAATFGGRRSEAAVTAECAHILDDTGLLAQANIAAGGLTLLERKRLELARALATRPRILLLDEIAGGLTDAECAVLIDTIGAIHRRGMSIIWIEHVLHALTAVVSRLVVLDFGRLIAGGRPDAVMASREVREIYLGIDV
jgi:branched-chain amino acid transport system ATP-binding protein